MSAPRITMLVKPVAWLCLGCHVLVASGLPVPMAMPRTTDGGGADRSVAKDRSRPFPCMDKACGCATAEQCFASCCCHTPRERLAWARARGVEPAVLAALERRVAGDAPPAAGCCASRAAEASCCAPAPDAGSHADEADVCRDYRSLAADPAEPAVPEDGGEADDRVPRTVILRDMLACGGIAVGWLACGPALPPPACVAALPAACPLVGFLPLADDVAPSVFADVSAPPPRVA